VQLCKNGYSREIMIILGLGFSYNSFNLLNCCMNDPKPVLRQNKYNNFCHVFPHFISCDYASISMPFVFQSFCGVIFSLTTEFGEKKKVFLRSIFNGFLH